MPLYCPQSWNDSNTVMASGIISTPTNSTSAGAASAHGARVSVAARRWPEPCRRQRSCGSSAARRLMSSGRQDEANGLAFGGLRLAIVLTDHDRRPAFGLALEQPVIALEDPGDDLGR